MRKGAQALSPEAEIGLIGELALLRAIIEAGVAAAHGHRVVGGAARRHPGLRDRHRRLGGQGHAVGGGIPRQDRLARATRRLHAPTALRGRRAAAASGERAEPAGASSRRCGTAIKGDAEAERLLSERLLAAGYIDSHADRYPRKFEQAGTRVVEVAGNFPRMTSGSVPAGIMKAMYEIDLDKAPGDNVGAEGALKKLGAI